jgi:transcriptional regulator with GAF, ATPase, and Fis domain
MALWLIALSGPMKGSVYPVTDVLTIGRAAENQICLDDELASRNHCKVLIKDGRGFLKDGDTRNGTWINGRAYSQKFLEEGDLIQAGSTTFRCSEKEVSAEELANFISGHADQNQDLETLRADYTVREPAAVYYRTVNQVFLSMIESLNALHDVDLLLARLLDLAFEMIPALRAAIWLNGPRVSPDPADFISKIQRERGSDQPARFVVSQDVLKEVFSRRDAVLTSNVVPTICAPLVFETGIRGVIYMEGLQGQARHDSRSRFEPEHREYLKGIARIAVAGIRQASNFESVRNERDLLKEQASSGVKIIGKSAKIQQVLEAALKAAQHDVSVLILGESGTGKELIARLIHESSPRRDRICVAVNCAAIAETLQESELFGHAKGAFTGAAEARTGKFKQADGGTIFLDEVGEMSQKVQGAVLRVLQERQFDPVGTEKTVTVDVRVIAATKVDLERAVQENKFREDLFYRLNVVTIELPPLRERREDIPFLVDHFLQEYKMIRHVTAISPESMAALMAYAWPGNIRELQNTIQAALIHGNSGTLCLEDLPKRVRGAKFLESKEPESFRTTGRKAAAAAQRDAILRRLQENGNNASEARLSLRMSKTHFYRLLGEK